MGVLLNEKRLKKFKTPVIHFPIPSHFNSNYETLVAADSFSYGLGAVLVQRIDGKLKSISYTSRSLTATEQRYAQIEKQALSIIWACECFCNYLIGLLFTIQTDHKPLTALFGNKKPDELSPRIQQFCRRLMCFKVMSCFKVMYGSGKLLSAADTLSRSSVCCVESFDNNLLGEVENYVDYVIAYLPASNNLLKKFRNKVLSDHECSKVINFCQNGWLSQARVGHNLQQYFVPKSSGRYSNLGARGKNFQKLMLSEKKRGLILACIFFSQNQGVL